MDNSLIAYADSLIITLYINQESFLIRVKLSIYNFLPEQGMKELVSRSQLAEVN
jgi:hypothetical protein